MLPIDSVQASLQGPRSRFVKGESLVPNLPGLYAIYGDERAWVQLGLGHPRKGAAIYVGKSERDMAGRLGSHFENGRTGGSTVRRSFAALLRVELELTGIPRNQAKPANFASFALSSDDDSKLTQWMHDRLEVAVWTADGLRPLTAIEGEVLREWNPPLNVSGVRHLWRRLSKTAESIWPTRLGNGTLLSEHVLANPVRSPFGGHSGLGEDAEGGLGARKNGPRLVLRSSVHLPACPQPASHRWNRFRFLRDRVVCRDR